MGTVIGVMVGYALGTRAGPDGWQEFRDAWKVIASSEEVRDLVSGGFSIGRDLLGRSFDVLREVLGEAHGGDQLRPVA
jgi:hypothetical protein